MRALTEGLGENDGKLLASDRKQQQERRLL